MKKIVLAISIAAITMAVGCNNSTATQNAAQAEESSSPTVAAGTQIAYIHIDSLMTYYDMYVELSGEFEAKAKKVTDDLVARDTRLKRDIQDYQQKVEQVLITRAQAVDMEEKLQKRGQDFMQYSNRVQTELAEEEQVMSNRIQHSLKEFLKEYNKDFRYAAIISTTAGGPILHANPAFDITKEVIEGLNKQYAATKVK